MQKRVSALSALCVALMPWLGQTAEPSMPDHAKAVETESKNVAPFKADSNMQAVLDSLAAMNGKPIETLEPAEARTQPTPTDAVMAVPKKQGKDTTPSALVPGVTSTHLHSGRQRTVPCHRLLSRRRLGHRRQECL